MHILNEVLIAHLANWSSWNRNKYVISLFLDLPFQNINMFKREMKGKNAGNVGF